MKPELGFVQINDIQFASESKMEDGTIYANAEELKALLLKGGNLELAESEIAKPGESVRVAPVKGAIESRVKVNRGGNLFPGITSKVETVGSGRTSILKGSVVITTGKIVGLQEGVIDMYGEGAKYTSFSQLSDLIVIYESIDRLAKHVHGKAVRFAGLKAAGYIGKLAKDAEPDEAKAYGTCSVKRGTEKYPGLPRVTYTLMLQSRSLMHNTYVYGVDMRQSLPTILSLTELVDGVALSGNCVSAYDKNTTYCHLDNPVVVDSFGQHGKTLNFVGIIITSENIYLVDKMRSSGWTSKLCKFLGVDGTIAPQKGFGSPDTDLIMNCKKIEGEGVKAVIITDGYAGHGGTSQSLADADVSANAIVTDESANVATNLSAMGKVIDYPEVTDIVAGGLGGSLCEDGFIVAELQIITGVINEMGLNRLSTR